MPKWGLIGQADGDNHKAARGLLVIRQRLRLDKIYFNFGETIIV